MAALAVSRRAARRRFERSAARLGPRIHDDQTIFSCHPPGKRKDRRVAVSTDLALARLLQLASPALPVGAYSYSQGLEAAVEAGLVRDAASAGRWIGDVLAYAVARLEAPVWWRLHAAWSSGDFEGVARWNDLFRSTRESAQLRAETLQMGYSLQRLLLEIGGIAEKSLVPLRGIADITFPAAFTFAVTQWEIPARSALIAYLWAWLENQVMAALKSVPLGQTDGQRLLLSLAALLPGIADEACALGDDDLCNYSPGFAILCSQHETQYSRLFRS
jgi:urease accessory protein